MLIRIANTTEKPSHTVGDSTLAESSTGNTRLADRFSRDCRFFIGRERSQEKTQDILLRSS
jgi:hypothetical protein